MRKYNIIFLSNNRETMENEMVKYMSMAFISEATELHSSLMVRKTRKREEQYGPYRLWVSKCVY